MGLQSSISSWAHRAWSKFRAWPWWAQVLAWLAGWWVLIPLWAWQSSFGIGVKVAATAGSLLFVLGVASASTSGSGGSPAKPTSALASRSPAANQAVPPAAASPTEEPRIDVPRVIGLSFRQARNQLEALGFEVVRSFKVSDAAAAGTIIAQRPKPGTRVRLGATVRLTVAKRNLTPSGITCPSDPLRGVYHSYRLDVIKTCQWFVGTVVAVRSERYDGDYHVDIAPDRGYAGFLNSANHDRQQGGLLIEIMPGQKLPIPSVGEHVSVFGTWVLDADHGWNELHPVWAIEFLDTGKLVVGLPPDPPLFNPDATTGGTGGSTGGGNCDPAYPTVCIPPPPPDLDCGDITYRDFTVRSPDPHHFDGDHDGIGCET